MVAIVGCNVVGALITLHGLPLGCARSLSVGLRHPAGKCRVARPFLRQWLRPMDSAWSTKSGHGGMAELCFYNDTVFLYSFQAQNRCASHEFNDL